MREEGQQENCVKGNQLTVNRVISHLTVGNRLTSSRQGRDETQIEPARVTEGETGHRRIQEKARPRNASGFGPMRSTTHLVNPNPDALGGLWTVKCGTKPLPHPPERHGVALLARHKATAPASAVALRHTQEDQSGVQRK